MDITDYMKRNPHRDQGKYFSADELVVLQGTAKNALRLALRFPLQIFQRSMSIRFNGT